MPTGAPRERGAEESFFLGLEGVRGVQLRLLLPRGSEALHSPRFIFHARLRGYDIESR